MTRRPEIGLTVLVEEVHLRETKYLLILTAMAIPMLPIRTTTTMASVMRWTPSPLFGVTFAQLVMATTPRSENRSLQTSPVQHKCP